MKIACKKVALRCCCMGQYLRLVQCRAGFEQQVGRRQFSELGIWHSEHGAFGHLRQSVQQVFDCLWVDILATGGLKFLCPGRKPVQQARPMQPAQHVDHHQVACGEACLSWTGSSRMGPRYPYQGFSDSRSLAISHATIGGLIVLMAANIHVMVRTHACTSAGSRPTRRMPTFARDVGSNSDSGCADVTATTNDCLEDRPTVYAPGRYLYAAPWRRAHEAPSDSGVFVPCGWTTTPPQHPFALVARCAVSMQTARLRIGCVQDRISESGVYPVIDFALGD